MVKKRLIMRCFVGQGFPSIYLAHTIRTKHARLPNYTERFATGATFLSAPEERKISICQQPHSLLSAAANSLAWRRTKFSNASRIECRRRRARLRRRRQGQLQFPPGRAMMKAKNAAKFFLVPSPLWAYLFARLARVRKSWLAKAKPVAAQQNAAITKIGNFKPV